MLLDLTKRACGKAQHRGFHNPGESSRDDRHSCQQDE